ncbi:hypothetical protein WAF17_16390 [Bernardetia sp. ABR2-2B]|uniref:hypothetical protein n=1 Tax=Bernardetia sp. ABR2-2B TaxID=3127472 RepID=UPI0030D11AE2
MQTLEVTEREHKLIKLALQLAAEKNREIATLYSKLTIDNHPQANGKKQILENLYEYEDLLDKLNK